MVKSGARADAEDNFALRLVRVINAQASGSQCTALTRGLLQLPASLVHGSAAVLN